MKNVFCKYVSIIGIVVLCILYSFSLKGNENLETSEISVLTFEKIRVEGAVDVRFHVSDTCQAVLTFNENLDRDKIKIFTQDDILYIKNENKCNKNVFPIFKQNFSKKCLVVVDVYCQTLTNVSILGSGDFKGIDHIISLTFTVEVSDAGNFTGTVETDNFFANVSNAGNISISGSSKDANITVAEAGDFGGKSFYTNNATINVSGAGAANLRVADNLKARVTDAGDITYYGNPKVDASISGAGDIRKR